MEKYVTNIKDLVIQAMTNDAGIKAKAESGDALSCFQMGMIYMLGIDTKIDFKKASKYLQNQSLSEDPDVNRLLGFIAECEGNYSQAFTNYAKAAKGNRPYINKVYEERTNLKSFLKKLDLPNTVQNKIITNVLNEYVKGGDTKVDASIRIAMICEDEDSCLDAAQALYDNGDYSSAMRWLKEGNISESNALYVSVKKKISDYIGALNLSTTLEVIELDGDSLLTDMTTAPSYEGIKALCDDAAAACKKEWSDMVSPQISGIKKNIKDEEAARAKKEKDEKAARLKKQKEAEFEAFKESLIEEEARKKKKRNMFLVAAVIVIIVMLAALGSSSDKEKETVKKDTLTTTTIVESKDKEHVTKTEVNIHSEEYLIKYWNDILPKAIKMPEEKAIEKYFSKDFRELYKKVDDYDKENVEEGTVGFWDFDFWTGGQEGLLPSVSVVKVSDFSNNEAEIIVLYAFKDGEYNEYKTSTPFIVIFENGTWRIDDFNSYKFRFANYLKEVGL